MSCRVLYDPATSPEVFPTTSTLSHMSPCCSLNMPSTSLARGPQHLLWRLSKAFFPQMPSQLSPTPRGLCPSAAAPVRPALPPFALLPFPSCAFLHSTCPPSGDLYLFMYLAHKWVFSKCLLDEKNNN